MNRLTINLEALHHNIQAIDEWLRERDATWTLVTKALCGHPDSIKALKILGIRSMADSRLENLQCIRSLVPGLESWYLRPPHKSAIPDVVELSDVSLNSELSIIGRLNDEAQKQDKTHGIIVMIELGDLREGILPGALVDFYQRVFKLPHINVLGIGANLGCLSGAVPNVDQLMQLVLYRELLELKFQRKLPFISAGSSAVLPLLLEKSVPPGINHFRIGESVFLGTDLVNGGVIPGLREDAFTLEGEIVEIKEKGLVPLGETSSIAPFQSVNKTEPSPGQRGYRAIVAVGQLDTEVSGLTPVIPEHEIAGASSDLLVVNLGDNPAGRKVGDSLRFRLNYAALVRLMNGQYIEKVVTPSIKDFADDLDEDAEVHLPPAMLSSEEVMSPEF